MGPWLAVEIPDLIEKGRISLEHIQFLTLDEADRMLDMGSEPQIRNLARNGSRPGTDGRHTLMFSATFPMEIQRLASDFMNDYIFLTVGRVGSTTQTICLPVAAPFGGLPSVAAAATLPSAPSAGAAASCCGCASAPPVEPPAPLPPPLLFATSCAADAA